MTPASSIKAEVSNMVARYARRSDTRAAVQVLNTFGPFLSFFYLALVSLADAAFLAVACIFITSLFAVRIFILMHDCGHNSLFRTRRLNQLFGFVTGVFCGMPQYVWALHHDHHHATNGNWSKYTGPLGTISVEVFKKLTPAQQKRYQLLRNIVFALPGAFMYFIVNPRLNWALGSIRCLLYVGKTKLRHPRRPVAAIARGFKTPCWQNGTQYRHILANNVVLLGLWWAAAAQFGAAAFFTVYLTSLTFGGAAAIILFTVQHNFESSYASEDAHWDYYRGAVEGTSCLALPGLLNWFTADVAYHHIHHLSARIPNYRLAACHREHAHLFQAVKRVRLRDMVHSFQFILWDSEHSKLITVAQFHARHAAVKS